MPLTLAILPGAAGNVGPVGQMRSFVASVTNTGSASVTLQSLTTSGDGMGVSNIEQPDYLAPNQPVGVGNPILLPGATTFYPFRAVFLAPSFPGPSPQSPGGAAGVAVAAVPGDSVFGITLSARASDSTATTASLAVPVLSTLTPLPIAQGGALQLNSGFNLVNLLTL